MVIGLHCIPIILSVAVVYSVPNVIRNSLDSAHLTTNDICNNDTNGEELKKHAALNGGCL